MVRTTRLAGHRRGGVTHRRGVLPEIRLRSRLDPTGAALDRGCRRRYRRRDLGTRPHRPRHAPVWGRHHRGGGRPRVPRSVGGSRTVRAHGTPHRHPAVGADDRRGDDARAPPRDRRPCHLGAGWRVSRAADPRDRSQSSRLPRLSRSDRTRHGNHRVRDELAVDVQPRPVRLSHPGRGRSRTGHRHTAGRVAGGGRGAPRAARDAAPFVARGAAVRPAGRLGDSRDWPCRCGRVRGPALARVGRGSCDHGRAVVAAVPARPVQSGDATDSRIDRSGRRAIPVHDEPDRPHDPRRTGRGSAHPGFISDRSRRARRGLSARRLVPADSFPPRCRVCAPRLRDGVPVAALEHHDGMGGTRADRPGGGARGGETRRAPRGNRTGERGLAVPFLGRCLGPPLSTSRFHRRLGPGAVRGRGRHR